MNVISVRLRCVQPLEQHQIRVLPSIIRFCIGIEGLLPGSRIGSGLHKGRHKLSEPVAMFMPLARAVSHSAFRIELEALLIPSRHDGHAVSTL